MEMINIWITKTDCSEFFKYDISKKKNASFKRISKYIYTTLES